MSNTLIFLVRLAIPLVALLTTFVKPKPLLCEISKCDHKYSKMAKKAKNAPKNKLTFFNFLPGEIGTTSCGPHDHICKTDAVIQKLVIVVGAH